MDLHCRKKKDPEDTLAWTPRCLQRPRPLSAADNTALGSAFAHQPAQLSPARRLTRAHTARAPAHHVSMLLSVSMLLAASMLLTARLQRLGWQEASWPLDASLSGTGTSNRDDGAVVAARSPCCLTSPCCCPRANFHCHV